MLLATIAASLFLIISGSIGLYIYFGNHIKETMYHAFLAGSHVLKIQIPLIYLLFIITIPLFMVFDRWMRKQYFKRHSRKYIFLTYDIKKHRKLYYPDAPIILSIFQASLLKMHPILHPTPLKVHHSAIKCLHHLSIKVRLQFPYPHQPKQKNKASL